MMTSEEREKAKASFHQFLEERPDMKEKFLQMQKESRKLIADITKDREQLRDSVAK